jgi:hypothetical protein
LRYKKTLYLCARFGREAEKDEVFEEKFRVSVEKKDIKKFGFRD